VSFNGTESFQNNVEAFIIYRFSYSLVHDHFPRTWAKSRLLCSMSFFICFAA
jgi:hypothetical protein